MYANNITWTISDIDVSSDSSFLAYSTLNPVISLIDINKGKQITSIDLSDKNQQGNDNDDYFYNQSKIRNYCLQISGNCQEILTGGGVQDQSQSFLRVTDIATKKVINTIKAHSNDINTIVYANKQNSAIFISGSDDGTCKIWDYRALGIHNQSVGYLLGHKAGIMNIQSRQDNYIASNSKDQTLKLWDIRKSTSDSFKNQYFIHGYDYRHQRLSEDFVKQIRNFQPKGHIDNSLHTFYGHSNYGTLIRCHFSPIYQTNQRYIYTGSYCGRIFVYDLYDGQTAAVLNSKQSHSCIRDVLWHPFESTILSATLHGHVYQWDYEVNKNYEDLQTIIKQDSTHTDDDNDSNDVGDSVSEIDMEDDYYEDEDESLENLLQN